MKTKQTIVCGVLAVILVLTFAACGDDKGDGTDPNTGGTRTAPTITTTSLPNGTVGTAYSRTLAAAGDMPITWSIETGTLPGGLNLSTAGVISGTPTTANTFNFTVKATNAVGSGTKSLSIIINPNQTITLTPTITTTSLPNGIVGIVYSQTLAATGNTPIVWNITTGSLPDGLNLSTSGVISGTPTIADTFNFIVSATNDAGSSTKTLSITVHNMTWTAITDSTFGTSYYDSINGIAYGNDRFVAVGGSIMGSGGKMAYSTNGATWTAVADSTFDTRGINGIAYGNNRFVAVGEFGRMAYSTDGITWTAVTDSTFGSTYGTSDIRGIAYGGSGTNARFVAVGESGKMAYSTNGQSWTAVANSTFGSSDILAIAYGNNRFVAVGTGGKMAYSADGISWTAVANSTIWLYTYSSGSTLMADINSIAYGNGRWVAGGDFGKMAYSADGTSWTAVTNSTIWQYTYSGSTNTADINGIAYGNNMFVAVGAWSNKMAYSADGASWVAVSDIRFDFIYANAIAYGNNRFVAGGDGGRMAYADW